MIIEVDRVYKSSGIVSKVMVNTDFIHTIEGVIETEINEISCRIVMQGTSQEPHIFYVSDKYSTLKTKIMGRRKK